MKEFLHIEPARYSGWGADGCYEHPWRVTNGQGLTLVEGVMKGKPFTPKLPAQWAGSWALDAEQYPGMVGRGPVSGVVFDSLPWSREV